jgi:xanthine dehydrogenase accessory factor
MFYNTIVVRGGGDIASGTIQKLYRSGFKVLVLEIEKPTSIRRNVSFSEAVYDGQVIIEEVKAVLIKEKKEIIKAWENESVPVLIDSEGRFIDIIKPCVVVDAILAKINMGTNKKMAPVTIALGPGFNAGVDVDVVIETMRGHDLGKLIFKGFAIENTGIPGEIGGYSKERVIHSPCEGIIKNIKKIGDIVEIGEIIALIEKKEIRAPISGVLRGLIRDESFVFKGLKIGDVDPRLSELKTCNTISDKARSIGGGVLEAVLYMKNKKNIS